MAQPRLVVVGVRHNVPGATAGVPSRGTDHVHGISCWCLPAVVVHLCVCGQCGTED